MGVATRIPLQKGASIPDFQELPGVDGKTYSLADFQNKKILVIFFSCNHCPYVQAYEERLKNLQREFQSQGVQFIAINSNDATQYPEDSFINMQQRAKEQGFNFLYLHDESQRVAKAFEATHTPHLFVFDENRKLAYTGKVDDNWQHPSAVTRSYLREALSNLVNGKPPAESETFAVGCSIKWKQ